MSAFLVSDRAGGNYQLALADGGALPVQAIPNMGGSGSGAGALIFPTYATLHAFDITAPTVLAQGQQAFVQSNGSTWTLMTAGGPPVDSTGIDPLGQTVVRATGVAEAVWVRENISGYLEKDLGHFVWNVDNQNTTAAASVEAPGTSLTPLSTVAEAMRRVGWTWTPEWKGSDFAVVLLSDPLANGSDPILFQPYAVEGATFTVTRPQPAAGFTGTLNTVTAKSQATGTALHSTFTVTTGAVAVSMLLINTTRGNSRAIAVSNNAGTWLLSQPLAPNTPPSFPTITEVDTWAHGDAIQGFVLPPVHLGAIGGVPTSFDVNFSPTFIVAGVSVVDPSGNFGNLTVDGRVGIQVQDTVFTQGVGVAGQGPPSVQNFWIGCDFGGFIMFGTGPANQIAGGVSRGGGEWIRTFGGNDHVATGPANTTLVLVGRNIWTSSLYIDTNVTVVVDGNFDLVGGGAGVYGPGIFDSHGAVTATAAAATSFGGLTTAGALRLGGQSLGYSLGPTVAHSTPVNGQVALTPTTLGAATGTTGFGSLAWIPGASIQIAGAQP